MTKTYRETGILATLFSLLLINGVLADNYSEEVLHLNPKIYYRLNEAAGQADGAAVINAGTAGASYNGTWGSGLTGYGGREPTSGEIGLRSTDRLGGRVLSGLTTDNLCAGFDWPGGIAATDMISINVNGEGGSPIALDSATQSYSMFFKTSSTNSYMRLITTDSEFTHVFTLAMGAPGLFEGRLYLSVGTNTTQSCYSLVSFNDGTWHHLVAVRGSDLRADLKLYVDGHEQELINDDGSSWLSGYEFRFGARGDTSGGFTGKMDEIAGWDIALTDKQVKRLFDKAAPPLKYTYPEMMNSLNPKIYYRLSEAAGQVNGAAVINSGTAGASYNGTWGSGLWNYTDNVAISGETGPRPTDTINGKPLTGLPIDNLCAGFNWTSGFSDMISINVGGEGGSPIALDSATQSYSMFFKTLSSSLDVYIRLVGTDPEFTHEFKLIMGGGKGFEGRLGLSVGAAKDQGRYSVNRFNDGVWHHVVAVRGSDSRADLRLYVDGKEQQLLDDATVIGDGYQFRFGAHGTASGSFIGKMDEIAGWNIALERLQAQDLFASASYLNLGGTVIVVQ